MDTNENLYQRFDRDGILVGSIHGKRFFVLRYEDPDSGEPGLMASLEGEGCFATTDFSEEFTGFRLMAAGFGFMEAPAVASALNVLVHADRTKAEANAPLSIEEKTNDR